MVKFFRLRSDVIDSGSLRPCDRFHFEMPKSVLKTAKAKACATKSSVRFLIAFWCLPTQYESGKWVRLSPHPNRIQRGNELCGKLQRKSTANVYSLQGNFFSAEEVGFRVECPTLISNCLANVTTCGGVRGCSLWAIDQQSYNDDKGNWLWARLSVHRIGYKIWRAEQLRRANRGARGHMRAALLRKC